MSRKAQLVNHSLLPAGVGEEGSYEQCGDGGKTKELLH